MAYLKIECSVARNKKFVKAGPAPSWLWVCGLAYCQEGLTDGFIPAEALPYLGVKNVAQLAAHLVKAGLWDVAPGGWTVHDYLEHNRSAADVDELKAKRAVSGKQGGRPKKNQTGNHMVSDEETIPVAVVASVVADVVLQEKNVTEFRGDVAIRQLQAAYPQNRVSYGFRTESAFIDQINGDGDAVTTFAAMLANLENHKASHEWRVKGMAPALEKWLRDGLWRRQMDVAAPVAEQLTAKSGRTLAAAAEVLNRRPA